MKLAAGKITMKSDFILYTNSYRTSLLSFFPRFLSISTDGGLTAHH